MEQDKNKSPNLYQFDTQYNKLATKHQVETPNSRSFTRNSLQLRSKLH